MLLNSIIREDKKRKKEMSLFVVPEKEDLFPQQKTGYEAVREIAVRTKKGRHHYWESALDH